MNLRFGDAPITMLPDALPALEAEGVYTAELKLDGWYTFVAKDKSHKIINKFGDKAWACGKHSDLFFFSRRGLQKGGPTRIPVNADIVQHVDGLDLPDQSMISGEWLARRTIGEIPESLFPFELLWFDNTWIGDFGYTERMNSLDGILGKSKLTRPINRQNGFRQLFEEAKATIPWSEGLVLKHASSKIKGSSKENQENALIVRVKFRVGASGREVYI